MERWTRKNLPAVVGIALLACSAPAWAESAFNLPYPSQHDMGVVPATAFLPDGTRLGDARVGAEKNAAGEVRIIFEAGDPNGERMEASAELTPVGSGRLRIERERSMSYDPDGRPVGLLEVDHVGRKARCHTPEGTLLEEVDLPAQDRVVNVPLNLLFQPLVRKEQDELEFQIFLCRSGARLMDFHARIETDHDDPKGVRVTYTPNLGLVSGVATLFAPDLAFWFAPAAPYGWQGSRMPIYPGGPEMIVVRDGLRTSSRSR